MGVPEKFGPYVVRERLGLGGMAVVHRAELISSTGACKVIALKRLLPDLAADKNFLRRFVDEARLGQKLHHANIAKTYAVGKVRGTQFIALEYVRGPTLLEILQRSTRGRVPIAIALHILIQASRALAYAHGLRGETGQSLGLIHRDIAPSNIMVCADTGATKLIDFGVAKESSTAHVRTKGRAVVGKLGYIAPEYFTGKLDARVDLFSFGVVAHELLTGRRLFEGSNDLMTAELVRTAAIAAPSKRHADVPSDLDDIVMTALQRDPSLRWQNALALHTALLNVARSSGLEVHDRDVAAWLDLESPEIRIDAPVETAEIEVDVDVAFATILAGTRSGPTIQPATE